MENKNTFGTIRLHKETIESLKAVKREMEVKLRKDITWDDFIFILLNRTDDRK